MDNPILKFAAIIVLAATAGVVLYRFLLPRAIPLLVRVPRIGPAVVAFRGGTLLTPNPRAKRFLAVAGGLVLALVVGRWFGLEVPNWLIIIGAALAVGAGLYWLLLPNVGRVVLGVSHYFPQAATLGTTLARPRPRLKWLLAVVGAIVAFFWLNNWQLPSLSGILPNPAPTAVPSVQPTAVVSGTATITPTATVSSTEWVTATIELSVPAKPLSRQELINRGLPVPSLEGWTQLPARWNSPCITITVQVSSTATVTATGTVTATATTYPTPGPTVEVTEWVKVTITVSAEPDWKQLMGNKKLVKLINDERFLPPGCSYSPPGESTSTSGPAGYATVAPVLHGGVPVAGKWECVKQNQGKVCGYDRHGRYRCVQFPTGLVLMAADGRVANVDSCSTLCHPNPSNIDAGCEWATLTPPPPGDRDGGDGDGDGNGDGGDEPQPSHTPAPPNPSATTGPTSTPVPPSATPTQSGPTSTSTPGSSPTPSNTPSATVTPSATPTSTSTFTPSPTLTNTATATPTNTSTSTPSATITPSPTPTATSTSTPTATATPTNTATQTPTSTSTQTPVPTDTTTAVPSDTPVPSPTATPAPQCRVIHERGLHPWMGDLNTSGSHIHVQWHYGDGTGEWDTFLPSSVATRWHVRMGFWKGWLKWLFGGLSGTLYEYADCTDEEVLGEIVGDIDRRTREGHNKKGYVAWERTCLFWPEGGTEPSCTPPGVIEPTPTPEPPFRPPTGEPPFRPPTGVPSPFRPPTGEPTRVPPPTSTPCIGAQVCVRCRLTGRFYPNQCSALADGCPGAEIVADPRGCDPICQREPWRCHRTRPPRPTHVPPTAGPRPTDRPEPTSGPQPTNPPSYPPPQPSSTPVSPGPTDTAVPGPTVTSVPQACNSTSPDSGQAITRRDSGIDNRVLAGEGWWVHFEFWFRSGEGTGIEWTRLEKGPFDYGLFNLTADVTAWFFPPNCSKEQVLEHIARHWEEREELDKSLRWATGTNERAWIRLLIRNG